ncbi:C-C motif chemokine 20a.3 [Centroberyx affinis]|uniref:C-C motif chemokine 20a.3 n=1 Tax=Centroberyx affinis TaxID=166261 RepID=UPI003A5BDFA3
MVQIRATEMALMLLAIGLLVAHTTAVRHECCRSYTRSRIPFRAIKGYSVQTDTEMCHISAIIFHTRKGKACTNPALDWVMQYVNRLRNKAQMVHNKTSKA